MFSLVYWVVFGAAVGGIARAIVPTKLPAGWLPTIGLGIAGSVAGGLPFGEGPAGFIGSIVGACAVTWAWGVLTND